VGNLVRVSTGSASNSFPFTRNHDHGENSMSRKRYSDFALLSRLFKEARPYWWHFAMIFLLGLLATPLALLVPFPLKITVDYVLGNVRLPNFLTDLLPSFLVQSKEGLLGLAVVLLVMVTLLQNLQGYLSWILQLYTGEKLVLNFRARLLRHIQRLSLLYHDMRGTADSLYRIQFDAGAMQYLTIQGVLPSITSALNLLAMIWVTARIDWQLAIIAILVLPLLLGASQLYRGPARKAWGQVKNRESVAMSVPQEVLGAIRVVKAFGQERREEDRFRHHANESLRAHVRAVFLEAGFGIIVAIAIGGGTAAVLLVGVRHVQSGVLSLGSLIVVMTYIAQLFKPLETLSKTIGTLQSSLASAERAFALLDELPDVPEKKSARPLRHALGQVVFRNVDFGYNPERLVLCEVSFEVAAGTSVGISGPTGAGKTTLVSLLPRFFDPTAGQILLDGVDLRAYRLADLRSQFAIVLQEPVLFSASIAENIAYGRPNASETEVMEAARAANAHDFIVNLPEGYQTAVGERGMRLSGGERQRISIARAFLRNAPVLILDEPTSAVDAASESAIIDAMERLMQNRTTFMIAHRISTLRNCDLRLRVELSGFVNSVDHETDSVWNNSFARLSHR
jgi:ATP-binding cassette, subfamily B, bacterial